MTNEERNQKIDSLIKALDLLGLVKHEEEEKPTESKSDKVNECMRLVDELEHKAAEQATVDVYKAVDSSVTPFRLYCHVRYAAALVRMIASQALDWVFPDDDQGVDDVVHSLLVLRDYMDIACAEAEILDNFSSSKAEDIQLVPCKK